MTSPRKAFLEAQGRMLDRYGVEARSRFVDVPSIGGRAHALVSGAGPPVVMINGLGTPGAMWAPLMAALQVVGGGHAPWLTQSERIGPRVRRFLREGR